MVWHIHCGVQVYGSDTAQQMRGLPLHQKVILCCLHRLRDRAAAITVGKLSTEYGKVCEMKNIAALDQVRIFNLI